MKMQAMDRLPGHWVLHSYLGGKPFDDRLDLAAKQDGQLEGQLSVPGAWTVPVQDLHDGPGDHFEFSIEPTEGGNKFKVNYSADFDPKKDVFVGFLRLADGELLGGFVGERVPDSAGQLL